jgi:hypothetical protein
MWCGLGLFQTITLNQSNIVTVKAQQPMAHVLTFLFLNPPIVLTFPLCHESLFSSCSVD